MKKKNDHKIDMRSFFLGHQKTMIESLKTIRENVGHEPTKGEGSEFIWIEFLADYLPERYKVDKAIIVDYEGNTSDAIDVVIYDRQYTPFVFKRKGVSYIPVESVYAVFEAKQEISKGMLKYAGDKVASVRKLNKTTAPVVDKGVIKAAPALFEVLGGFLCLDNGWKDSISNTNAFATTISSLKDQKQLNIGCVLNDKSFVIESSSAPAIKYSTKEEALIFFFLKLVLELQKLGTVRPIDLNKYIDQLNSQ